jgi:hypothetical protein
MATCVHYLDHVGVLPQPLNLLRGPLLEEVELPISTNVITLREIDIPVLCHNILCPLRDIVIGAVIAQ